ncbi:AAA family ATPase [bacterium]|nr:AAA family ATPase [bacterium]
MTDKGNKQPVMVAGLRKSGKTAFICALIQLGHLSNINLAALKPFDIGLIQRNAIEGTSDGELFCRQMAGDPMEILVSPYVANEVYPVEMAFRRDGIKINWGFLRERLKILNNLYALTLVELPGSLYTPVTEEKMVFNWLRESGNRVIWLINPVAEQFEQNLAEISLLKSLDLEVDLVINNTAPITNQDLLMYIWEKIEQQSGQEIVGMVPHVRNLENSFGRMAEKTARALPSLIDRLIIPPQNA